MRLQLEVQRRVHRRPAAGSERAQAIGAHLDLAGEGRVPGERQVRMQGQSIELGVRRAGLRVDRGDVDRQGDIAAGGQRRIRRRVERVHVERQLRVVDRRRLRAGAGAREVGDRQSDVAADHPVAGLRAVDVERQVAHRGVRAGGAHLGAAEGERALGCDPAGVPRRPPDRQLRVADLQSRPPGTSTATWRSEASTVAEPSLARCTAGADDQRADLVVQLRRLRGHRRQTCGEPVQQPRAVDIAVRLADHRIPRIGQVDGRIERRRAIAGDGALDPDLRRPRARIEVQRRLGVQPVVGVDAGGEGLPEHAQIERRGDVVGGRVHGQGEARMRRLRRGAGRLARERELERRGHRTERRLQRPARGAPCCRSRRHGEREPVQLGAIEHGAMIGAHQRQAHVVERRVPERWSAAEEAGRLVRERSGRRLGERRNRGREEQVEGGPPRLVHHHGDRGPAQGEIVERRVMAEEQVGDRPARLDPIDLRDVGREGAQRRG